MAEAFVEDIIGGIISYIIYFWNTYLKVTINVNTLIFFTYAFVEKL